ncbi:MAG: SDR family oxidoreductase [Lachnospiraceae bacterium]|nr:SDR family oxidoreductase [Lachnospiraceae bacterium]
MVEEYRTYEKTYLIIGASSDVGLAYIDSLARRFREGDGVSVCILAHYHYHKEPLLELARKYPAIELKPIQADLSDEKQTVKLIEEVLSRVTYPNYILHFPAMPFHHMRIKELDTDDLRLEMNVQVYSLLALFRTFLPLMNKEAGNKVLVMLTSYVTEELPPKFMTDYIVTKYALMGAMKSAAAEYGGKNVKINGIAPIMMDTKFLANLDPKIKEITAMRSAIGRVPGPEELIPYIDEMLDDAYTENGFVRLIDESCFGEKERND